MSTGPRLLKGLGFKEVRKTSSYKVRVARVYEYPPRIKLPDLKKVKNPDTRLIIEAIADHRLPRQFSVHLLHARLGQSLTVVLKNARPHHLPNNLHNNLTRWGFTSYLPEEAESVTPWLVFDIIPFASGFVSWVSPIRRCGR